MPPGTGLTSAAYMQPPGIGSTTGTYMQSADIGYTPASHTQLSMGPAYPAVYYPPSASYPPAATITTSIGHGRELLNLAKIYTNDAKYCDRNDKFIFKLAIFYDICLRADVLPEAKIKAFPTMLKGLTLDYYYSNISISAVAMNFYQVCNSIKNYFKRAE